MNFSITDSKNFEYAIEKSENTEFYTSTPLKKTKNLSVIDDTKSKSSNTKLIYFNEPNYYKNNYGNKFLLRTLVSYFNKWMSINL